MKSPIRLEIQGIYFWPKIHFLIQSFIWPILLEIFGYVGLNLWNKSARNELDLIGTLILININISFGNWTYFASNKKFVKKSLEITKISSNIAYNQGS